MERVSKLLCTEYPKSACTNIPTALSSQINRMAESREDFPFKFRLLIWNCTLLFKTLIVNQEQVEGPTDTTTPLTGEQKYFYALLSERCWEQQGVPLAIAKQGIPANFCSPKYYSKDGNEWYQFKNTLWGLFGYLSFNRDAVFQIK